MREAAHFSRLRGQPTQRTSEQIDGLPRLRLAALRPPSIYPSVCTPRFRQRASNAPFRSPIGVDGSSSKDVGGQENAAEALRISNERLNWPANSNNNTKKGSAFRLLSDACDWRFVEWRIAFEQPV